MNIISTDLEFSTNLPKRDNDLYSLISTKIILCDDPRDNLGINTLHQKYQSINNEGSPYHFVVYENGDVNYSRSRLYRSGFDIRSSNVLKNSFYILIAKESDSLTSEAQQQSLVELLAMILIQDNLLVTDITSIKKITSGDDQLLKNISSLVSGEVIKTDPFRTVGDDIDADFSKFVSNSKTKNVDNISTYTGVPANIIRQMNPHIVYIDGTEIQTGTTIFLPGNRMSDYLKDILNSAYGNVVYTMTKRELLLFKEQIDSYERG